MARIAGGGTPRNRRAAMPSANEMLGAMGQPLGFGPKQTRGMMNILSQEGTFQSPFAGLPTAASSGEFFETISLLNAQDTMRYYNPQTQAEANSRNRAGMGIGIGSDFEKLYEDAQGKFVDRGVYRESYEVDEETGELLVPGEKGAEFAQGDVSDAPAPLSLVPTSTSNPERPRTVAAGYDRSRSVLTVVFRDGTYYNYYDVDTTEWQDFKRRVSKGKYIYQYLDYKPRGPASVSALPSYARSALYKFTRAMQLKSTSKQYDRNAKKQRRPSTKRR